MSGRLVKISEFCSTGSGGTPSRANPEFYNGNIPWIKSGELREDTITTAAEFITELALQKSSAKIVPKGAILLAMYGATVGRMATLGIDAATNQAVCSIVPDEKIAFSKYVYYALLAKVPYFLSNAIGGAQPNISQGMIKDTEIFLPSLQEQKRIAAILDKADAIRRKRQQAIQLADDFLRAVFLDMFGDPITNPKGWRKVTIGEVTDKVITWSPNSIENLVFDYIDLSSVDNETKEILKSNKTNSKSAPSRARQLIQPGDVLVSTVRPNLNGVAKVINNGEHLTASTGFCVLRPKTNCVTQNYLFFVVTSQCFVNEMINKSTGANYPAVSDSIIKNYEIELPPANLLSEFENKCRLALEIKVKYRQFFDKKLFESLSQKAFAGQL